MNSICNTPANLRTVESGADILAIMGDNYFRSDAAQWGKMTLEQAFEAAKNRVRQYGDTAMDLLLHAVAQSVFETEHATLAEACDEAYSYYGLSGIEIHGVCVRRNANGMDEVIWRDPGYSDDDYAYLEGICKYAQLPPDTRPDWIDDEFVYVNVYGRQNGGKWITLELSLKVVYAA